MLCGSFLLTPLELKLDIGTDEDEQVAVEVVLTDICTPVWYEKFS